MALSLSLQRLALRLAWIGAWLLIAAGAGAGTLDRAALQRVHPSPWIIGERDPALPVWPVYQQVATEHVLIAWLFESADFAALPGFSGTPMNLLVALDPQGKFLDVRVLSQHEPVFLDGLGEGPLHQFVGQYAGLSLRQALRVGPPGAGAAAQGHAREGAVVTLDGVAKATASVRVLNQSVVSAALQVARARLGFAAGRDPDRLARWRGDAADGEAIRLDWSGLEQAGLVASHRVEAIAVAQAYADAGLGAAEALGVGLDDAPAAAFAELRIVPLSLPQVGRSLLDARGWQRLQERLEPGDTAFLVLSRGRYPIAGEEFVRGSVPDRLLLRQGELPLEWRDLDLDIPLRAHLPADWRTAEAKVLRVIAAAGLDPAQPMDFVLRVTRLRGQILAERVQRDFGWRWTAPAGVVERPDEAPSGWRASWQARQPDLVALSIGLAVLAVALLGQRVLVRTPARLRVFRGLLLAWTLLFVGWHAQAQLSVVHLTATLRAWREDRPLAFLLEDPVSIALWAAVAVTLVVWGRGTFCGWLCPYGVLQGIAHRVGRLLRLPVLRVPARWDRRLRGLKYLALAAIALAAWSSTVWTDRLVAFEPFKTAITLGFRHDLPHVAWAGGLLLLGAFVYKAWCRYLCPLGAALAIGGSLRRWGWIPRRAECGTPCQTCRHRCDYQAIAPDGRIDYSECFQCLDCVEIHDSDRRCAPRLAAARGRTIAIRPLAVKEQAT